MDLDGSGAFATDISAFWYRQQGLTLSGLGRRAELDAAGAQTLNVHLDNRDGRFNGQNGSSPYASGGVNQFRPYIQIWIKATFNAVTYELFKGVVTMVQPKANSDLCYVSAQDYFYLLSRTDVRRPLMLDQFTGVIINRILDDVEGAENREIVANPIFETGTTGWSLLGGGSIARVTTGELLEGSAALYCVTTAVGDEGARYTTTGKAGVKVTAVAYIKRGNQSQTGGAVKIRIRDNLGIRATGTPVTVTPDIDRWTRITVTGTWDPGSSSQFVDVLEDISAADGSFRIGAVHAVPFVAAITRNVDGGQSRLGRYQRHRGPALEMVQEVRDNELGALFYFNGAGAAVFEDRHHRWKGDHLTSTVTLTEKDPDYSEHAADRIKAVILDYPRYVDGTPGTQVWDLDGPLSIPANGSLRVEADYGGGLVRNTITPVANTDYFVMSAADGSGTDQTGIVTLVFRDFGGGSESIFSNSSSRIVYLTALAIRATPVREASDLSPARYTASGGPVLAGTLSYDYRYNDKEPDIQAWATYLGLRYSTQRERLSQGLGAAFPEAALTTDMVSILARQISDRITVVSTALPFAPDVNGAYYIDSMQRRIEGSDGQGYHFAAEWRLSPVDVAYARTGVSMSNGSDGHITAP